MNRQKIEITQNARTPFLGMKTSNYMSAVFVFAFEQGMSFGTCTASAVGTVVRQSHGLTCQHTSAGCAAVQLLLMGPVDARAR